MFSFQLDTIICVQSTLTCLNMFFCVVLKDSLIGQPTLSAIVTEISFGHIIIIIKLY